MEKRGFDDIIDTIYLNPLELKVFNFLKLRSADSSEWPSLEEIQEKFEISYEKTQILIRSLREKEGIVLHSQTREQENEKITTYGLFPETLEVLVRAEKLEKKKKRDFVYKALYLAEPCFGTKASDEHIMKGLALFLESNKEANDIQEVIIQGGVIPHVPPYSTVSYVNDLRFLGYVSRNGKKKGFSEKLLEEKIENDFEMDFYEEHINNSKRKKITDLTDAFSAAEEQLKVLMEVLPEETVLRIQFGEEDRKNVRHIENAYIKAWAEEKGEKIGFMREEVINEAKGSYKDSFSFNFQKYCLEKALENKKLRKTAGETRQNYYERVLEIFDEAKEEIRERNYKLWEDFKGVPIRELEGAVIKKGKLKTETPIKEAINYLYWANNDEEKIKKKMNQLGEGLRKTGKKKREIDSRLENLSTSLSWTNQLLAGSRKPITWFTGQYPTTADELELLWKKAKDAYSKHFFKWDLPQQMLVHVSPRKNVRIETDVIEDVVSGKKSGAEVEYEIIDKKLLLIHNIRNIFSDSVGPSTIRDAKLEMNYQDMVLQKLFEQEFREKPDIVLLGGHTAGGFRVMPWFKQSQYIPKGKIAEENDMSYLIKLPTLQSIPKLEWLVEKGFRNWHTKNYEYGPYASAAVLHTINNDNVNNFLIIDTSLLMEFGEISEEIEEYRKKLKGKISKEKKKEIFDLIKGKKNLVKAKWKKIEAAGDHHLGSPDMLGRYSKDQLIKASQIYQIEHGLPNIISWDEILHGVEKRIFESASRYNGRIPEKFYQSIIIPILNSGLSEEEKVLRIVKETMANQRAITIHNDSEQKNLFKLLMSPYAQKVISRGGKLILTSGNHYNKSITTSDEALELANQFPEEYIDSGKIHAFSGKGNDFGMGAIYLEGNRKLYVQHKFPERQDEVYGIMTHLRKMNNDADIVIAGDRHQAGLGYADGHLIVLHPGYETLNEYVPVIGKPPGVRGFMNILYDINNRGLYRVDMVLNSTLEKIIQKENII